MRSLTFAFSLVAMLFAFGCSGDGPSGVKITGKILRNGSPAASTDAEPFTLSLNGTDAKGKPTSAAATVKPSGEFTLDGPTGQGVPAGEYAVNIEQIPYGPRMAEGDRLKGAYKGSASKLKVVVPASGSPTLTVDVGMGTATLK